jgi:hypothetical protein
VAQQSARRDRKNQGFPPCFISTLRVMWFRSANSHTGPQLASLDHEAGQMAASDYVPNLLDLPLASFGASTDGKRIPPLCNGGVAICDQTRVRFALY